MTLPGRLINRIRADRGLDARDYLAGRITAVYDQPRGAIRWSMRDADAVRALLRELNARDRPRTAAA